MARRGKNLSKNQKKRKRERSKGYYINKENNQLPKNDFPDVFVPDSFRNEFPQVSVKTNFVSNHLVMGKRLPPRLSFPDASPERKIPVGYEPSVWDFLILIGSKFYHIFIFNCNF